VRRTRSVLFGVLLALVPATPAVAAAPGIAATLDGRPLAVAEIPQFHCHDLDYPIIRCFRKAADRDAMVSTEVGAMAATAATTATTAVVYVTVYENTNFSGASLSISQNYDVLATIGWNDRISSFKGRNAETGVFYVDWFASGSSWAFCCNTSVSNLSAWDNSFSSVYRT
jgi:hypothetical protein